MAAITATPGGTSNAISAAGIDTTLDAIASAQPASQAYRAFLRQDSMEAGIYQLGPGATGGQEAHARDELYVILEGTATLEVDGTQQAVSPGSMAWVRAGVQHRFTDLAEGLRVLVIFANAPTNAGDPAWMVVSRDQLAAAAIDPSRNVWSPFLKTSTMTAGLYLLPAAVGGDRPQTHGTDELNLVFSGTSSFVVDDAAPAPIGPGSVMTVNAGHRHAFAEMGGDVVDLIVWPAAT
jgi:mannose-6-phosphate isomerase-like protein (cupin superfamily)